jgi:hypothetical protein
MRFRGLLILAATAALGSACARGMQGTAAGDYIDPAEAAKTVTLRVDNSNPQPMELRVIANGQSYFVGSVGGFDTTSVLLDPRLFPTGNLYVAAIPADGRGRAVDGPLAASKGDVVKFRVSQALNLSRAIVVR